MHIEPGLALAHAALIVTPEDISERQPVHSPLGHVLTLLRRYHVVFMSSSRHDAI
jgi:hypothetical protein